MALYFGAAVAAIGDTCSVDKCKVSAVPTNLGSTIVYVKLDAACNSAITCNWFLSAKTASKKSEIVALAKGTDRFEVVIPKSTSTSGSSAPWYKSATNITVTMTDTKVTQNTAGSATYKVGCWADGEADADVIKVTGVLTVAKYTAPATRSVDVGITSVAAVKSGYDKATVTITSANVTNAATTKVWMCGCKTGTTDLVAADMKTTVTPKLGTAQTAVVIMGLTAGKDALCACKDGADKITKAAAKVTTDALATTATVSGVSATGDWTCSSAKKQVFTGKDIKVTVNGDAPADVTVTCNANKGLKLTATQATVDKMPIKIGTFKSKAQTSTDASYGFSGVCGAWEADTQYHVGCYSTKGTSHTSGANSEFFYGSKPCSSASTTTLSVVALLSMIILAILN